ncbi:MAG: DegT/DnrJ/EryC1/StrS family aminotransferase [Terriglobia bacterium]
MQIPLSNPDITSREREYVLAVLNTPHLSLGPLLPKFEDEFAKRLGVKHAIAVNSGTSGLHLAVRALELGEGDSVITTPFSFVASSNCLLFERVRPVFVDIDPVTFNLDPTQVEAAFESEERFGKKVKGILPVHVFGRPCQMERVLKLSSKHRVPIIEDACEALGAVYRGKLAGTFGTLAVFAFYPNKQMTTGEGGMIVTDDPMLAALCRSMRNQGRGEGGGWLAHERLGYNYRLSDINCALGIAQLERLDEILSKRARVADLYAAKLAGIEEVTVPCLEEGVEVSWFVYVIKLADQYRRTDRDRILEGLRAKGIGCNNYFTPIHLQPFYQQMFGYKAGDFPITESVAERTIALPFFNNLDEIQISYVVEELKQLL